MALTVQAKNAAGGRIARPAVMWSTSDSSVAVVTQDGTLSGVGAGRATLTAASGSTSTSITVTVRATASVASVDVTPREARLTPGGSLQLSAIAMDARGTRLSEPQFEWASSDPGVVTVSSTGVARGIAAGRATVTATSAGRSATVAITVGARATVASLEVAPARLHLAVRGTAPLQASARDARGSLVPHGRVAWASTNAAVATVTPTGVVTGVAPGTTKITAESNGVWSSPAEVTVGPAAPGILQLMLVRDWAVISIDGLPRGQRTRSVDTLPSGVPHRLHFERNGFVPIDTTVTLAPGETMLVRILMTPKS